MINKFVTMALSVMVIGCTTPNHDMDVLASDEYASVFIFPYGPIICENAILTVCGLTLVNCIGTRTKIHCATNVRVIKIDQKRSLQGIKTDQNRSLENESEAE